MFPSLSRSPRPGGGQGGIDGLAASAPRLRTNGPREVPHAARPRPPGPFDMTRIRWLLGPRGPKWRPPAFPSQQPSRICSRAAASPSRCTCTRKRRPARWPCSAAFRVHLIALPGFRRPPSPSPHMMRRRNCASALPCLAVLQNRFLAFRWQKCSPCSPACSRQGGSEP